MKLIYTIQALQEDLNTLREAGKSIGLVPTMGALHRGHIALVDRCVKENDVCVVSVFVNPTQFNDLNDLVQYPRTLEADVALLQESGCGFVFAPSVEEMYPEPDTRTFDFGALEQVMEGAHRPGHFNGVAQVVSKLFFIVKPDRAYFGEKDFQQLVIVRTLVSQLRLSLEIVPCPIVREESGLAMSSRNARLSEEGKRKASLISKTLFESHDQKAAKTVNELKQWIVDRIQSDPLLQAEYVSIVDGNTLQEINDWEETAYAVVCLAVFCEGIRLIDNTLI